MASGVVRLETQTIRVEVNVDRGAEIQFIGTGRGQNVLEHWDWLAPMRASRSASYGCAKLDWLSEYRGGWQEMFPNAGDAATVAGIPHPFHGEVSASEWEVLETGDDALTVRTAARIPITLERRMTISRERAAFYIRETITNQSALSFDYIWGHHPAFHASAGAEIDMRPRRVVEGGLRSELNDLAVGATSDWPMAPGRSAVVDLSVVPPGPVERFSYLVNTSGWAAIRDHERGIGVGLAWDTAMFRHAWFWEQLGAPEFPWFGRAKIVAIEPVSTWPADGLSAAINRRRAGRIGPYRQATAWVTCSLFSTTDQKVTKVTADGIVRQ